MRIKFRSLWPLLLCSDLLAIIGAYYLTLLIRFHSAWGEHLFTIINRYFGLRETGWLGDEFEAFYVVSAPRIIALTALTVCALYALRDLYSDRRFIRKRYVGWNILVANATALGLFFTYFYLRRNVFHPRGIFLTILAINTVLAAFFRGSLEWALSFLRERAGIGRCHVVIIGSDDSARLIDGLIEAVHPHGLEVVARVGTRPEEPFEQLLQRAEQSAVQSSADMLIVAERTLSVPQIMQLLELAAKLDLPAKVLSDQFDIVVNQARIPSDYIHGIPLLHFDAPCDNRELVALRHCAARAVAALLLLLLAPLLAFVALVLKVSHKGPVFFTQERIGINHKPFRMFKFRTMHDRADEAQASLEEFNDSGSGLFKLKTDPRVTRIGRILRRFSIDELPQLVNVMRGEMTLVGPRPLPRRDFEHYYEDWHYSRHGGLPGLTCLWQVSGRSDIDFHNMCILDIFYLRNQTWVLDLRILLRTIWTVIFGRGAY